MQITGGTYVVLWSPHQRHFHVETVSEMLETNLRIYAEHKLGDYILLSFAADHSEAHKIAGKLRQLHETPEEADEDASE